jgi:hypothetical protein
VVIEKTRKVIIEKNEIFSHILLDSKKRNLKKGLKIALQPQIDDFEHEVGASC